MGKTVAGVPGKADRIGRVAPASVTHILATALQGVPYDVAIYAECDLDDPDETGLASHIIRSRLVHSIALPDLHLPRSWLDLPLSLEQWALGPSPWIDNLSQIPEFVDGNGSWMRNIHYLGMQSWLCFAVPKRGRLFRSVTLGSHITGCYGSSDLRLMEANGIRASIRMIDSKLRQHRLRFVNGLRRCFTTGSPIEATMKLVARLANELDWDYAGIYRVNRAMKRLELVVQHDRTPNSELAINPDYVQAIDVGLLGHTLREDRCQIINDLWTLHPQPVQTSNIQLVHASRSALCYPLQVDGITEWLLDCESTGVAAFRGPDRRLLDDIIDKLTPTLGAWFESLPKQVKPEFEHSNRERRRKRPLGDSQDIIMRLDKLDTTLERLTRAHGGIGHNRPPEEIQTAALSCDLCEETVKTVHSLRDDINAPNPNPEAIRAKTHVLQRAAESLAAFLGRKWEKVTDKMAETVFLGAAVAYGPLVYKYAFDAYNQIGELIRAVEGWITSLPSLF
jgi:putative methionine-R-sulfoxide reductase with GAF domain